MAQRQGDSIASASIEAAVAAAFEEAFSAG